MTRNNSRVSFRDSDREKLGARPYACDFHLHAHPDWQDPTGNKPLDQFIEEDYLPRVFQSGRQVIGIPQHNSIFHGGAKTVRDVARRMLAAGRQDVPVVFPGYELTSSDQIQVILLANPDDNEVNDLDTRVHESLELQQGRWHESRLNLCSLLDRAHDRFRSRLIALVVATGHKGILEDRDTATRLRNIFRQVVGLADGFIISKPYTELDDFTKRVLNGELEDYTDAPVAWLQTSDARTFDALQPAMLSYVKLGSFTIEGVRQALLNNKTFLSPAIFHDPDWTILRMRVRKTVFFDDLQLDFNPHMTCLIGGRGTGKSCLLEYVSHACQYQRAGETYDRPNKGILWLRKEDKTDGTLLPETEIDLSVKGGQKFYRIRRKGEGPPEILECADERCEGGVPVSTRSPSALLNLRFFGQRELANIVRDESFFSLDPERRGGVNLFSFLKSDQLSQVDAKERQARQLADEIEKLSVDMASWALELIQKPRLVAERARLNEELLKIKSRAAHPAFQSHQQFTLLETARNDLFAALSDIHAEQTKAVKAIEDKKRRASKTLPDTQTGAESSLLTVRTAALKQVDDLIAALRGVATSWLKNTDALAQSTENALITERIAEHSVAYGEAKKEMEANKINLTLLEPLQARLQEIDSRISHFDELDTRLNQARTQRRELVSRLRQCRSEEGEIYVNLADALTTSTKQRVRMRVVHAGDIRRAISDFQGYVKDGRKFNSRDAEQLEIAIRKEVPARSLSSHPAELWTELADYMLAVFEHGQDKTLGRTVPDKGPTACSWAGPILAKVVDLMTSFDDKQIGRLLCQYVPDSVNMELRRKVDTEDYISIQQASVGQKATALFLILLAQTDGLLVIDQPEDDLDNAFITNDILPAIQELKHQQQIIFATHNANMLVNAESEKIVVLDTEPRESPEDGLPQIRGHIAGEGGIDNESVRERVTKILEGGKDAFLARERKYRFAHND
ncbi:MAG: hypothetical protein F9K13_07380 [Candidatus Methylomirabilis oxygeniifera]|uniref:ATPase AAA-type core domain-containing protein n=1 Tax=Methylomirabilis oxygeniifera TaxID=671143 RepID=D5ML68_METO1|nr:MAG: hypothetical protein F9K13_07380 [Candidatus Methylomirabilis oxyfera]CBE69910.1 protein of unknown function [Candidatus Methylomirabilis oxyfera]